ncbi:flavodoxin family protein [Herbidospora sp. NEAU-GS84]|uniref:Flavodoxin family protein n=1 Tax=Herbidospora solisilvae TaxID=2696284 RepID=A0A7C9JVJ0_9ACTN|nr:NAD(P)H-dependent oxidoreductase [Herbidospora solisilvae]NAS23579.1 flavodoxin family protein [Herbidospora solisilvae]
MKALVINCTLKPSPAPSNTQALADVVIAELGRRGVEVETVRAVDLNLLPGVATDLRPGDDWPAVHAKVLESEILVIASPTWVGHPSSVAQRVIERMDAMISETDDEGRPVAYNRVAGVVNTGNEDGAHHVISEICGALIDIGFTIPGQAWTYWHLGPGAGPDYLDDQRGHDWSAKTGRTMAANLVSVAAALAAEPMDAPPE